MRTISIKEKPYILECDRNHLKDEDKTIFWIIPRTVRDGTDVAESYGKAFKENKRKQRTDLDKKAFNNADDEQWLKHIIKIENAYIDPESPEDVYDHFLMKVESDPSNYLKGEDGFIRVVSTEDDKDRIAIFIAMGHDDAEEVVTASSNYSVLQAGSKN